MNITKIVLFFAIFIGLIILQREVINPITIEIVGSDSFLVDTDDEGEMQAISTPLSDIAFMHCNSYIRDEIDQNITLNFPDKPLYAWDIGNHQYVINAKIEVISNDSAPVFKKYVCRISYSKGDNIDAAMNFDNWSVYGLSGLDDL